MAENRDADQISLFGRQQEEEESPTDRFTGPESGGSGNGKKAGRTRKAKPEAPPYLRGLEGESAVPLWQLFAQNGRDRIAVSTGGMWERTAVYELRQTGAAKLVEETKETDGLFRVYIDTKAAEDRENLKATLIYADSECNLWYSELRIHEHLDYPRSRYYWAEMKDREKWTPIFPVLDYSISPWKLCDRLLMTPSPVQREEELKDIIRGARPWAADFLEEEDCSPVMYLMAPQLEQLSKAGFDFAADYYRTVVLADKERVDRFNRLTRPGGNPKEIFKTPRCVWSVLRNCSEMSVWDNIRRLEKTGKITGDSVRAVYNSGYSEKQLHAMGEILNRKWNGKPVFTFDSLVAYLDRLDTFEAIGTDEALLLLSDYLHMCGQLGMQPKTDGNSLKREHDIAARNCRQSINPKLEGPMLAACRQLEKYNYEESVFIVRGVRSLEDLMNEAKQQHSCVASYALRIIEGQSLIYFIRERNNPDRSLVTVELSPDGKIRQKRLSYNRPVHSRAVSEFIDRWLKHVAAVNAGGTDGSEE